MRKLIEIIVYAAIGVSLATPALSASACNQWDFFRKNGRVEGMDLKAIADAVKNKSLDVKGCYGTDQLRVRISISPFEIMDYGGTLDIVSSERGDNATTTFKLAGRTFKMRVTGEKTEILAPDGTWKDIGNLANIAKPLEGIRDGESVAELVGRGLAATAQSQEHLAPIADGLMVVGIGGLVTALAVPYLSQYAPLAENEGRKETVGGYSTHVWSVTSERAEQYAASKGHPIDATGSYIRYWISSGGLIIKIDGKFGPGITSRPETTSFTYEIQR